MSLLPNRTFEESSSSCEGHFEDEEGLQQMTSITNEFSSKIVPEFQTIIKEDHAIHSKNNNSTQLRKILKKSCESRSQKDII